MDEVTARFLESLRQKRERLALGLIESRHTHDTYLEVFARCLELEEVINQARTVFKGDEDDGDSDH